MIEKIIIISVHYKVCREVHKTVFEEQTNQTSIAFIEWFLSHV